MKKNEIELKEESQQVNQVLDDRLKKHEADLSHATEMLYNIPKIIQLKKDFLDVNKKAQQIQLSKFKKLNYDFEYEKDDEFQELMKQKQEVMNKIDIMEKEREISELIGLQSKLHEQIKYYESQIEIIKNQMKEKVK